MLIPYTDLKHIEQQGRVRFWPVLLPLGPKVHMQWGNVNDEMKVMKLMILLQVSTVSWYDVMGWYSLGIPAKRTQGGLLGPFAEQRLPRQIHRVCKDPNRTSGNQMELNEFRVWHMIHVMIWSDGIISYLIISFGQWFDSQGLDLPKSISLQSIGHCIGVPSPAMFEKLLVCFMSQGSYGVPMEISMNLLTSNLDGN